MTLYINIDRVVGGGEEKRGEEEGGEEGGEEG